MKTTAVSEAFSNAPPQSAAVLCVEGEKGRTDMVLADWFTWLNIKRNPMISFSLPRNAAMSARLRPGDSLVLAFPLPAEAKRYQQAVSVETNDAEQTSGQPETIMVEGISVRVPGSSGVLLRCTLAGAYNYPFKKVRIFNCNLEEALGSTNSMPD